SPTDNRLAITADAPEKPVIKLVADRLVFAAAPLPGLASGHVVGEAATDDLSIGGTLTAPVISGTIRTRNADLRPPGPFEEGLAGPLLPMRPTFHLAFVAGQNVRIWTPQLSVYVRTPPTEPTRLDGTVGRLRLSGTLTVDRGTLAFPTARFAIQRGGTVSL